MNVYVCSMVTTKKCTKCTQKQNEKGIKEDQYKKLTKHKERQQEQKRGTK